MDGVASGFSSSDYVTVTPFSALATDEVVEKITFTTGTISGNQWILGRSQNSVLLGVYINSSGKLRIPFIENNGSAISCNLDYVLSANTSYSVIVVRSTNGTLTSTLYDNQETVLDTASTTAQYAFTGTGNIFLGVTASGGHGNSFDGSIDLNHTYIKVNGQPWFGICPIEVQKHQLMGPVGYEEVGSPTITDGVLISPTDKQNTIKTSQVLNVGDSSWEMQFKVLNPTVKGCALFRVNGNTNTRCTFSSTNTFNLYPDYQSDSSVVLRALENFWSNAVDNQAPVVYLKISCIGKVDNSYPFIFAASLDGNSWTTQQIISSVPLASGAISYCSSYNSYQTGTSVGYDLDLNETYIKVNGKLWFWQPQSTKKIYVDNIRVWEKST
ncbi:MAG: hypothetical protein J6Y17_03335 [Elusimicrobiaceae bacterium]|nr:hypothetical protein [Elusimicrobiaceae bacterium]